MREPVQVYLTRDEKALLDRLSTETGVSRAELLRRGLRELALRHTGESPMLVYLRAESGQSWAAGYSRDGVDAALADSYAPDAVNASGDAPE